MLLPLQWKRLDNADQLWKQWRSGDLSLKELGDAYADVGLLRWASFCYQVSNSVDALNAVDERMLNEGDVQYDPRVQGFHGLIIPIFKFTGNIERLRELGDALFEDFKEYGDNPIQPLPSRFTAIMQLYEAARCAEGLEALVIYSRGQGLLDSYCRKAGFPALSVPRVAEPEDQMLQRRGHMDSIERYARAGKYGRAKAIAERHGYSNLVQMLNRPPTSSN